MHAYCPDCETELDESSGICPACRWDPLLSVPQHEQEVPDRAGPERFSVDDLGPGWSAVTARHGQVSKTRVLVILGLLGMATIYWLIFMVVGTV